MYRERGMVSADEVEAYRERLRTVDLAPGPGGSRITDVTLSYPGAYRTAFVALYPSSQLVAHCDAPIRGRRYHIPLLVNDGCWSFSGGYWQQLEVGRIYEMDPTVTHGAVNWGAEVRVHLMVDMDGEVESHT